VNKKHKKVLRKQYLINWRFQLKYVAFLILFAALLLGLFATLSHHYIGLNFDSLIQSGTIDSAQAQQLLQLEKEFLKGNLLRVFGLVMIVVILFGIYMTHRMAGPVFALSRRMKQVARGDATSLPFQIRKTDEFQELASSYREMMHTLQERNIHILERLRDFERELSKVLQVMEKEAQSPHVTETKKKIFSLEEQMKILEGEIQSHKEEGEV